MVLRKNEKQAFSSRRPYFVHKTANHDCIPETALHFSFKNRLAETIRNHVEQGISMPFTWECGECKEIHNRDLTETVNKVVVDHHMTETTADIALLDEAGNVIMAIHIRVASKPEEKTLQFYKDNNIVGIEIVLSSFDDLDNVEKIVAVPDRVGACRNPKCPTCKRGMHKTMLTIAEAPCWQCNTPMKFSYCRKGRSILGPSAFNESEIELARSKGVIIKEQYSSSVKETYLANSCGHCGTFIGEFYLPANYASPVEYGEIPSTKYEVGYHCETCENEEKYDDDKEQNNDYEDPWEW